MKKIIIALCLFIILTPLTTAAAKKEKEIKAAFIRENDLWIKTNEKEERITSDHFIRFPKWSFDGTKLAYLRTTNINESFEGDLWIYDLKQQKQKKVLSGVNANFEWAPNQNKLAFLKEDHLYTTSHKHKPVRITTGIISFSWYPQGKKILVSAKANKGIYSDIQLTTLTLKNKNSVKASPLYKIDVGKKDYYYGTSSFTWSHDKKWIAFQITPAASLSADSNTLSIISNDGSHFTKLEHMLNYENWFAWAPTDNRLGFIMEGIE